MKLNKKDVNRFKKIFPKGSGVYYADFCSGKWYIKRGIVTGYEEDSLVISPSEENGIPCGNIWSFIQNNRLCDVKAAMKGGYSAGRQFVPYSRCYCEIEDALYHQGIEELRKENRAGAVNFRVTHVLGKAVEFGIIREKEIKKIKKKIRNELLRHNATDVEIWITEDAVKWEI